MWTEPCIHYKWFNQNGEEIRLSQVTPHNRNHTERGGKGGVGHKNKKTLNANCYGSFRGGGEQSTSLKHSLDQAACSLALFVIWK